MAKVGAQTILALAALTLASTARAQIVPIPVQPEPPPPPSQPREPPPPPQQTAQAQASGWPAPQKAVESPSPVGRWGVGYTSQLSGWPVPAAFGTGLGGVAVRKWTTPTSGYEAALGLSVGFGGSGGLSFSASVLAKLLFELVSEKNMRLYWAPGLNLAGGAGFGAGVGVAVGAEFFLQGLPNLGFGAEVSGGLGIAIPSGGSVSGAVGLGAYNQLSLGVRYYL